MKIKLWFVAISLLLACAVAAAQTPAPVVSPQRKTVLDRLQALTLLPEGEWRFHTGDIPHGESAALDDTGWQSVKPGFQWESGTAWFRRVVEVPPAISGYSLAGAALRIEVSASSDFQNPVIVYVNGTRVAMGEALEAVGIAEAVRPGQKITVAVKVLCPPEKNRLNLAAVRVTHAPERPDPALLWSELAANEALALALAADRAQAERQLDAAFQAVNFAALERGDQAGFDASLRDAHARLEGFRAQWLAYSIRATGNAHIDMAWLWPWSETVEVVRHTFRTALELMNEYPDYTFTQSSAAASAWLEEKYPLLFGEIQRRVKEGRWELVGGMWVEPDLNMPDGESQVRQLLVGTRYFREKFGKEIRVGWNPDSFGYNWQLPQIYKKSGMDFFVTQKMAWNDTTKFPYKLFWWEAPDGSRILTYFPHDYVNSMEPVRMARDLADYAPRTKNFTELLHLYGIGDHGGGPTRVMFDEGRRWQQADRVFPRVFYGTALGFFEGLEKKVSTMDLPVWRNELYFEFHRGVFTSQAETKKNNRRSEALLLDAEKFASLAFLRGRAYPGRELNDAWRKVLFNQFHDIASGSGISAIYRDADRDYAEIRHMGNEIAAASLAELAAAIHTDGPGVPLLLFNSAGWARTEMIEAEAQLPRASAEVNVRDAAGRPLPAEVIERKPETNRLRIRFLARDVPSLGYTLARVVPVGKPRRALSALVVREAPLEMENEFLRVRVDAKTGCITSLVEKKSGLETIAPGGCGNLLQAFVDKPKTWDAWNIDADFEDAKWDLLEAREVKLIERSALRAVIRVQKEFQKSTFVQNIILCAAIPRVDVQMDAEWREKHILLKVAFPVNVKSDTATFEIPFGAIERPTTRRTPEEKAKFEVPALRWADLSDTKAGLSLLNDSKYGYDARENVLRLSLLRSPEWPDKHADEGSHHFTYSLFPHAGGWKEAGTVRRGYELNDPIRVLQVANHAGPLPSSNSFVQIEPQNVVLTALKKAEDDDGLILRFYEWAGREGDVTIHLPPGAAKSMETDLMERPGAQLGVKDSRLVVHTRPYEIKCLKVLFSR